MGSKDSLFWKEWLIFSQNPFILTSKKTEPFKKKNLLPLSFKTKGSNVEDGKINCTTLLLVTEEKTESDMNRSIDYCCHDPETVDHIVDSAVSRLD